MSTLAEFANISRVELTEESEKVSMVKVYLQDVKVTNTRAELLNATSVMGVGSSQGGFCEFWIIIRSTSGEEGDFPTLSQQREKGDQSANYPGDDPSWVVCFPHGKLRPWVPFVLAKTVGNTRGFLITWIGLGQLPKWLSGRNGSKGINRIKDVLCLCEHPALIPPSSDLIQQVLYSSHHSHPSTNSCSFVFFSSGLKGPIIWLTEVGWDEEPGQRVERQTLYRFQERRPLCMCKCMCVCMCALIVCVCRCSQVIT